MRQERTRPAHLLVAAAACGALLGFLGARVVLVGSGLSLVPWAVVGLGLGLARRSGRLPAGLGATYGFALAYTFMVTGYDGAAALHTRLLPFVVLGAFGALCGMLLAVGGQLLRRRVSATRPDAAPTGTASRAPEHPPPGSTPR